MLKGKFYNLRVSGIWVWFLLIKIIHLVKTWSIYLDIYCQNWSTKTIKKGVPMEAKDISSWICLDFEGSMNLIYCYNQTPKYSLQDKQYLGVSICIQNYSSWKVTWPAATRDRTGLIGLILVSAIITLDRIRLEPLLLSIVIFYMNNSISRQINLVIEICE